MNQEIINSVDEWLYGKHPSTLPGLHSYWENAYHHRDDKEEKFDVFMTFYQSFARIASQSLSITSGCRFTAIWKVSTHFLIILLGRYLKILVFSELFSNSINLSGYLDVFLQCFR